MAVEHPSSPPLPDREMLLYLAEFAEAEGELVDPLELEIGLTANESETKTETVKAQKVSEARPEEPMP
jgi:hypothetical protein